MNDDEVEGIDIDGVADGYKHLGNLSSIAVSCLPQPAHQNGHNHLCRPIEANWELL